MQYRIPVLEDFVWQPPVLDRITEATLEGLSPSKADRYLLTDGTNADNIAWYDGSIWKYDAPLTGMVVYVISELQYYTFDGSNWSLDFRQGATGTTGAAGSNGTNGTTGATGADSTVPGPTGTTGANSIVPGPTGPAGPENQVFDPILGCMIITL